MKSPYSLNLKYRRQQLNKVKRGTTIITITDGDTTNRGVLKYLGGQNELRYWLDSFVNILNHQWQNHQYYLWQIISGTNRFFVLKTLSGKVLFGQIHIFTIVNWTQYSSYRHICSLINAIPSLQIPSLFYPEKIWMSEYTWKVVFRVFCKLPTPHRQYPPLNYALALQFPT